MDNLPDGKPEHPAFAAVLMSFMFASSDTTEMKIALDNAPLRLSAPMVQMLRRDYGAAFGNGKRRYSAHGNGSDYHVLATDGDGFDFVVADSIHQRDQAQAIATLLNFAAALYGCAF
jgi:hypothetical protein